MSSIGIVGLDTSHGEAFAEVFDGREDATLTAVWDGGTVRSDEYTREFCDRYGARKYDSVEGVADVVDAALVLTVDWDEHRDLALPFLTAGIPTLVDKPIAGSYRDLEAMGRAAVEAPLFGGSAVQYHRSIEEVVERGTSSSLYCVGYNDPFYYGSHLVDVVRRIVGQNWVSVEPSTQPGVAVDVVFENDDFATLRFDGAETTDFTFLSVGDETSTVVVGSDADDRRRMYESFIDAFLDVVAGSADETERVLDAAKLLLGVHAALEERRVITPRSDVLQEFHVPDDQFVDEYAPYY